MNWEMFGAISEDAGGLAVIISILYLARQMKQSRLLAFAESQRAVMSASSGLWAQFTHLIFPPIHHVEMDHMMHEKGLMDSPTSERSMSGIVGVITTDGGAQ